MIEIDRLKATAIISLVVGSMTALMVKGAVNREEVQRTQKLVFWLEGEIPKLDPKLGTPGILLKLAEDLMKEFP